MKKTVIKIAAVVLAVLALIVIVNRRLVRILWDNLTAEKVPLDESEDWAGGMSYEFVRYSEVSETDYLHLYVPESDEPMPLAVMVHGGGFIDGDADTRQAQYVYRYFRDHGYASATVNYRLAQEAPYPAAVEDVKAAVRFLRANAEQYGYDPDRFVILGESAGGYLATMAAVTSDEEFMGVSFIGEEDLAEPVSARVSALVDFYGIMDFFMEDADWKTDGIPGFAVSLANGWMKGRTGEFDSWMDYWLRREVVQADSPETASEEMLQYSPSTYIRENLDADSGFHAMILHGDADLTVSIQNSERLYRTFADTIGEERVVYRICPGCGHAADRFFSEESLDGIREYLDSVLG